MLWDPPHSHGWLCLLFSCSPLHIFVDENNSLLHRCQSTSASCHQAVETLPWRFPKAAWMWAWELCCGLPCLGRDWSRWSQRSLPATSNFMSIHEKNHRVRKQLSFSMLFISQVLPHACMSHILQIPLHQKTNLRKNIPVLDETSEYCFPAEKLRSIC